MPLPGVGRRLDFVHWAAEIGGGVGLLLLGGSLVGQDPAETTSQQFAADMFIVFGISEDSPSVV